MTEMRVAPNVITLARGLSAALKLAPADLEKIQLARLRPLIEYAYTHVPYYRKLFAAAGFQPRHLNRIADLRAVPVTTRAELQKIPRAEIVSSLIPFHRLRRSRTSGATGMPLAVYRSRRERLIRRLLTFRAFRHHGIGWGDRVVTVSRGLTGARSPILKNWPGWPLWNLWLFDEPERMVENLRRLRPSVIYGFASNLAIVADLMIKRKIDDVRPRILATSSDLLTTGFRRVMSQAFGVEPIDIYNCTEVGDIGWQCAERRDFHLNADGLIVEILRSGEPAQPGDYGEVVVTPLFRYAMPLIRYSPGDVAQAGAEACSCDVTLPTLGRLDGRTDNIVTLPKGRLFVGFSEIMSYFPEIVRYQIIQQKLDAFLVKIIPGANYSHEIGRRIGRELRTKLGTGVLVHIETVDAGAFERGVKVPTVLPLRSGHETLANSDDR